MLFSIIVPIYKVEKELDECIQSILKQTYNDYELILVDDGSPDNCPVICDRYASMDNRIKVIHKPNGGSSSARNAGTRIAKGVYIVFIDSDDYFTDNRFLEKLAYKTKENYDLIQYRYSKVFEDGTIVETAFDYKNALKKKTFSERIQALVSDDAFYGMAWIKAIKRSLLAANDIEFEEGLLGEDMEWNYHVIYNANSIDFIDESVLAYRQRSDSISHSCKIKNLTDFIYILEKWSKIIKESNTETAFKTALYGTLAKYYSNMLVIYSRVNDKEKVHYKKRIKKLSWVLKYSVSKRPKLVYKIYRLFGFEITILALTLLDKVKK